MPTARPSRDAPQITIIGLGPMGLAVARALQAVKTDYRLVGHDRDVDRARAAVKAGHVDRAEWNLPAAVEPADLVILGEPLDELIETLAEIADRLRPSSLVTDLSAVKTPIMEAAERLLPEQVSFIGGHPIIDVRAAAEASEPSEGDGHDPAPDGRGPFQGRPWCLVPSPKASDESMRVLGRLVRAVGAEPYYIDAGEHDALVAGTTMLPRVALATLCKVLQASPSATDLRRLSEPVLADVLAVPTEATTSMLLQSEGARRALARWLGALLKELQVLDVALRGQDDDALARSFDALEGARAAWVTPEQESVASTAMEELTARNVMRQMLLGGWGRSGNERDED